MSGIEPAVENGVDHPIYGAASLPGCFQIDRPRVAEFSVAIVSSV